MCGRRRGALAVGLAALRSVTDERELATVHVPLGNLSVAGYASSEGHCCLEIQASQRHTDNLVVPAMCQTTSREPSIQLTNELRLCELANDLG